MKANPEVVRSQINPSDGPGSPEADDADIHARRLALLDSPEFKHLVTRRWRVSLLLTALLFVLYYGYILLIAMNRAFLSRRIGDTMTLGIPLGVVVILGAWALTGAYVVWANRTYDGEVARLRRRAGAE
jgi:uncharacterized membrane protein (DUF485 family)